MHSAGFKDFLLKNELNRAIVDCGFEHPSEVQQECIPQAIVGRDVICQAVSGMGKTAVFVISILQELEENPKPNSALILCNTRELAYQIQKEVVRFTKHMPDVRSDVFYGGVPKEEHVKILKGDKAPHIVIGTPGRIMQLCKEKHLILDNLQIFVLDECDKMLSENDMRGHVQQIFMSGNSSVSRQVMMFSATMNDDVKAACKLFMKQPFELYIDSDSKLTLHGLKQYYIKLEDNQKIMKLVELLDELEFNQVIIFVSHTKYATKLQDVIKQEGFPSIASHGDMKQDQRIKVYNDFKEAKYRVMISTDMYGRGIDIEKINIVINFHMPDEPNQYLHRVGRAGRFGTKGLSISFISSQKDTEVLNEVQSKFEVKVEELPATIDKSTYMNN